MFSILIRPFGVLTCSPIIRVDRGAITASISASPHQRVRARWQRCSDGRIYIRWKSVTKSPADEDAAPSLDSPLATAMCRSSRWTQRQGKSQCRCFPTKMSNTAMTFERRHLAM
jgi:hypothetical protein